MPTPYELRRFQPSHAPPRERILQIDPPLLPPWKHTAPVVVTTEAVDVSRLTERIDDVHARLERQVGAGQLHVRLLEYVSQQEPSVVSVQWESYEDLHLVLRSGTEFSMRFDLRGPDEAEILAVRRDTLLSLKHSYEANLRSGGLIAIGYGAVLTIPKALVGEVWSALDPARKRRSALELKPVLQHDELVREFLFVHDR